MLLQTLTGAAVGQVVKTRHISSPKFFIWLRWNEDIALLPGFMIR